MREVGFKGKRIDNGEWIHGYFWKEFDETCYIGADIGTEWDCKKYRTIVEVVPETVGQYTGIKDKNYKELYEGDIVVDEKKRRGYIAFLQQEMGFVVVYKEHDSRIGHRNRGSSYAQDDLLEIIGNIHENKELLEV